MRSVYYQKPLLVDLNTISDDEIAEHGLIAPLEFALKKAYKKRLSLAEIKLLALIIATTYPGKTLPDAAQIVLEYTIGVVDYDDQKFIEVLYETLPQFRNDVMSIAERLEQRGIEKGAAENARQMALKMFKEGADITFVKKVSGLPKSELNRLAKEAKNEEQLS